MRIYGCVTSALVVLGGDYFYILSGDHRAGNALLPPQGPDDCMAYFMHHADQRNKFSAPLTTINTSPSNWHASARAS